MFCPQCKTEYIDGIKECADCRISLVHTLPAIGPKAAITPEPGSRLVPILETGDSYEFLTAADGLRDAGIPFTGDEHYTGEFRPSKVAQAPYVWTLLVPENRAEEARQVLDGEPISGPAAVHLMSHDTAAREYSTTEKVLLLAVSLVLFCGMVLLLKK